jgi:hypothetical protein
MLTGGEKLKVVSSLEDSTIAGGYVQTKETVSLFEEIFRKEAYKSATTYSCIVPAPVLLFIFTS